MAIAERSSGTQRGTNKQGPVATCDIAFPGNVAAGSFITVKGAVWHTNFASITVAIVPGSSTATIGTVGRLQCATGLFNAGGYGRTFIAYAPVLTAGTLTMRVSTDQASNNWYNVCCDEFTGSNIALDVDGGESHSAGASSVNLLDTITTLTANDLIIGVGMADADTGGWTPGASYTLIASDRFADYWPYGAEFRIVTSPTSYNVDFTLAGPRPWNVISAAFKETAAAAGVPRQAMHARRMRS